MLEKQVLKNEALLACLRTFVANLDDDDAEITNLLGTIKFLFLFVNI
jgi:hypothetical protein